MTRHPITYKGHRYFSLKDLYNEIHHPSVTCAAFYSRIHAGLSPVQAATAQLSRGPGFQGEPIVHQGVTYPSVMALYNHLKQEYRQTRHRRPGVSYGVFIDVLHRYGVEEAVKRSIPDSHNKCHRDLKASSRKLAGADNLVCQRMTKLGWSYEKAISTPRHTHSLPHKCKWKGKTYRSFTECFKAIRPKMSYPRFCKMMHDRGY